MLGLTEEEYDALDEYYTKILPKIDPSKKGTGYFTRHKAALSVTVDDLSAKWLLTKALADHKTPAEIISEMVHERITASA